MGYSESTNSNIQTTTPPPVDRDHNGAALSLTPFTHQQPQYSFDAPNRSAPIIKAGSLSTQSNTSATSYQKTTILIRNDSSLNDNPSEFSPKNINKAYSLESPTESNRTPQPLAFPDPARKVPRIANDIEISVSSQRAKKRKRKKHQVPDHSPLPPPAGATLTNGHCNEKETTKRPKTANPNSFPPDFIRCRLDIFADEFDEGVDWINMHRGYHIYKDFLADYYEIIHLEFSLKLYTKQYVTDHDLEIWVHYLEQQGFTGLSLCRRDGGYLHILSTFLWLNVVHAADHTIADNIIRDFGIGGSYVAMRSEQWYKDNEHYNFVDVLEGKSCCSRWRLQFYAFKNRMFWEAFGGPKSDICFVADYFMDSNLYRRFIDVDDINENQRIELNQIHAQFIRKLKNVDLSWRWLIPVEEFNAGIHY